MFPGQIAASSAEKYARRAVARARLEKFQSEKWIRAPTEFIKIQRTASLLPLRGEKLVPLYAGKYQIRIQLLLFS